MKNKGLLLLKPVPLKLKSS